MSTTKINTINPATKKRDILALCNKTKRAKDPKGRNWSLGYLKKLNIIGFFETHRNGKLVQKQGEVK